MLDSMGYKTAWPPDWLVISPKELLLKGEDPRPRLPQNRASSNTNLGRPWTAQQNKQLTELYNVMNGVVLAALLKRTLKGLYMHAYRIGLRKNILKG